VNWHYRSGLWRSNHQCWRHGPACWHSRSRVWRCRMAASRCQGARRRRNPESSCDQPFLRRVIHARRGERKERRFATAGKGGWPREAGGLQPRIGSLQTAAFPPPTPGGGKPCLSGCLPMCRARCAKFCFQNRGHAERSSVAGAGGTERSRSIPWQHHRRPGVQLPFHGILRLRAAPPAPPRRLLRMTSDFVRFQTAVPWPVCWPRGEGAPAPCGSPR
jgi:hypothetical protein